MDLPGTFTILVALVCYLLAMQWGGTTKPWSNGSVIATLVFWILLVVAFVTIEWLQKDRALLQFRLLKDRTIGASCAFIFVVTGPFFVLLYYLPIYFQATRGVSAQKSGVDNLPLVLGAALFTIISGGLLAVWGHFVPVMAAGATIASVGCGLIYTLGVDSPSSHWIPYQAIAGIGLGTVFQVPIIVNQSLVKPSDISSVTAMTLFFQMIGGATFISAGQAGFANKLLARLPVTAPGVDKALVLVTGASDLRSVFSPEQLPGILSAYLDGLRVPYTIALVLSCVAVVLSFAPRMESIRGKIPGMNV